MFNDPARRFRFGITITNTSTRLWFPSRVQCFVSKQFNFVTVSSLPCAHDVRTSFLQNHHPLVHFFASNTFASLEELGYDLTVRRVLIRQPASQCDLHDEGDCDLNYAIYYKYLPHARRPYSVPVVILPKIDSTAEEQGRVKQRPPELKALCLLCLGSQYEIRARGTS